MCGRFTLVDYENYLVNLFGHSILADLKPRYNISPGQDVLVTSLDKQENYTYGFMRFGLIPSWSKEAKSPFKLINARSETMDEKPTFKNLFKRRRCLVIADSYYEWQDQDGVKQPYRISLEQKKTFAMAALWDRWQDTLSCSIVTTAATKQIASIHHRMPVILSEKEEKTWLSPHTESFTLKNLCDPKNAPSLNYYPVSREVNNARFEDEACIKPIESQ